MTKMDAMGRVVEWWPVDSGRWRVLESLFGAEGAYGDCWCMWYRQSENAHFAGRDGANRTRLQDLVRAHRPPGVLLYVDGVPAGWCSLGPREEFGRIMRSPSVKPIDDRPAWAIVCFFIAVNFRGAGLQRILLDSAITYARNYGVQLLEACPLDRRMDTMVAHSGGVKLYEDAGFVEVHRRTQTRPIMLLHAEDD